MHEWPADESDWKHSLKWIREWEELGWGEYQECPVRQTAAQVKRSIAARRDSSKRSFGAKTRTPFHFAQARNSEFIYTTLEKTSEGPKRSLTHHQVFPPMLHPLASPHACAWSQSWGTCCVAFLKMLSCIFSSLRSSSLCIVWLSAYPLCLQSCIYPGSAVSLMMVGKCWLAGWALAGYGLKFWHGLHVRVAEGTLMKLCDYSPEVKMANVTWSCLFCC